MERVLTFPQMYIVSDSVGVTAQQLVRAAAVQFGIHNPALEILSKVQSWEEIERFITKQLAATNSNTEEILVFYTLVNPKLREAFKDYAANNARVIALDLLGDALAALARISGLKPHDMPGELRIADEQYFKRIEAMEFSIAHDDGQRPEDLAQADIVLLGVSRTSKTPTSIYLSQQGYKVANIPLDSSTQPPNQLFSLDSKRIFGLVTSAEVLREIRQRRLGNASGVAQEYADLNAVYEDLDKARALMRKLGCIVINTNNRAIEETAQEILRYYHVSFPQFG